MANLGENANENEPQELLQEFKTLLSSVADAVGKTAVLPSVNQVHGQWKEDVSKLLKATRDDRQVWLKLAEKTIDKLVRESGAVTKRLNDIADTHSKTITPSVQALRDACQSAEHVVLSYTETASGAQLAADEFSKKMRALTDTAEKILAGSELVLDDLGQDRNTFLAESAAYIESAKASLNDMTAMLKIAANAQTEYAKAMSVLVRAEQVFKNLSQDREEFFAESMDYINSAKGSLSEMTTILETAADAQTEYAKVIEHYSAAYYDKLEKSTQMFRGARRWLIFLSLFQCGIIGGVLYWFFHYVIRR